MARPEPLAIPRVQRLVLHCDVRRVAHDHVIARAENSLQFLCVLDFVDMLERISEEVALASALVAGTGAVKERIAGGEMDAESRRFGEALFFRRFERGE